MNMNRFYIKKRGKMNNQIIIKLILPIALLASGCAVEPQKVVPEPYLLGQVSFHKVCANCHGADAIGSNKAPRLIHSRYSEENFSNKKVAKTIMNGSSSGAMPSQKNKVTKEDIKQIIKYLRYSQKDITPENS
jgi:mono/diheme cytochrome c family protein